MKRRRVLALVPEGQRPPESLAGIPDKEVNTWKMEYDVLTALRELGHETTCVDVGFDLGPIRAAVEDWAPHVVFNMLEEFHGIAQFDQNVVAWLELLKVAYTGCNPRGLVLARDKALAKKIMAYHRIPTPRFLVVPHGRTIRRARKFTFPLFVKSTVEDASMGISQASIVHGREALDKRVAFVHESTGGDALVEEYIEGREMYLGILGNTRLTTFPLWELVLEGLPEGTAPIATRKLKFDLAYQEKHGIRSQRAEDLPEGLEARIARVGKRVYRALGMSGYGRLDLRVTDAGQIHVLEANPNPDLSADEDFALAAEAAGLGYDALIHKILTLGRTWHRGMER